MKTLVLAWTCLLLTIPCSAATIVVDPNGSADYTTIQAAINASWDGDTVIVRPSTYNEAIKFNGRRITLTSKNPDDEGIVSSTIITSSPGPVVTFDFSEGLISFITGFTITGYGTHWTTGTGIYCDYASPTITKNIIRDCDYVGIRCSGGPSPTISSNTIINNGTGSNVNGGGICGCDGLIYKNIIHGNRVKSDSGAGLEDCDGTIMNNVISLNEITEPGSSEDGGAGLEGCDGTIINNTIVGNSVFGGGVSGGAILDCLGVIKNNIIAYNSANLGGGISSSSCDNSYNAFWENEGGHFYGGATAGTGDFIRDPLFAAPDDYHLQSTVGRYDPSTGTWVIDAETSPCIDVGDPCDPIGVEPNSNGGRINIGAYGGTAEASKSDSGIVEPVCPEYPMMDANKDCKVDFADFIKFASEWLDCNLDPQEACWE